MHAFEAGFVNSDWQVTFAITNREKIERETKSRSFDIPYQRRSITVYSKLGKCKHNERVRYLLFTIRVRLLSIVSKIHYSDI